MASTSMLPLLNEVGWYSSPRDESYSSMADLDFLDTIRLINFLRSEAKEGNVHLVVPSKDLFQQDIYLQPFLPDDPLLYSLGDLPYFAEQDELPGPETRLENLPSAAEPVVRSALMSSRLAAVEEMLDSINRPNTDEQAGLKELQTAKDDEENDSSYFESYSYNGDSIHRVDLC